MPGQVKNENEDDLKVSVAGEDDVEIHVEDDTPPEDRGRKPVAKDDDDDGDPDKEAEKYTKGVQKRINEVTHRYHDARRRAEAAERERQEAIEFGRKALQRARLLEQQLGQGEVAFSSTAVEKEELALKDAQAEYKAAYEAGDPDAIAKATAKMAVASQRIENAKQWTAQAQHRAQQLALQNEKDDVDSIAQGAAAQQAQDGQPKFKPTKHDQEWMDKNSAWFGKNRKMTSYVYGIHDELVNEQGLHPVEDAEEYYAAVDAEMRQRFPDYDWDELGETDPDEEKKSAKPDTQRRTKTATPVAPVSRVATGSGKKSITLTASEARIAQQMGLTLKEYALEKAKLEKGAR